MGKDVTQTLSNRRKGEKEAHQTPPLLPRPRPSFIAYTLQPNDSLASKSF